MSQQFNSNAASLPIIYRHFESTAGSHIDSIVKEMKELAEEKNKQYNDRVFVYTTDFNGHTINSSMTIDEIYKELYGCTKEEMDKKRNDMDRVLEKLRKEEQSKSIQIIEELYPKLTEQQKSNFDERCLDCRNDTAMLALFKKEGFSGAALGLVKAIIHKIDKECFYKFNEIAERICSSTYA